MIRLASSNHATVKERPVTTLDKQPAKGEGRMGSPAGKSRQEPGSGRVSRPVRALCTTDQVLRHLQRPGQPRRGAGSGSLYFDLAPLVPVRLEKGSRVYLDFHHRP